MAVLLVETVDIDTAIAEEQSAPPGLYEVRLYRPEPISEETKQDIFDSLYYQGVDIKGVYQKKTKGLWYVGIRYRKHAPTESIAFAWALLIPLIPTILVASLIGIGLFKIEEITRAIIPILLAVGGFTVIALALIRKPLGVAAERYAERRF